MELVLQIMDFADKWLVSFPEQIDLNFFLEELAFTHPRTLGIFYWTSL